MISLIKRKYKLYKARKQIIKKYNDFQCSLNFSEFKSRIKEYNRCFFNSHHDVEHIFTAYDVNEYDELSINDWLNELSNNITTLKQEYENLLKFYAHKVRMAHWMYVHHKSKITPVPINIKIPIINITVIITQNQLAEIPSFSSTIFLYFSLLI